MQKKPSRKINLANRRNTQQSHFNYNQRHLLPFSLVPVPAKHLIRCRNICFMELRYSAPNTCRSVCRPNSRLHSHGTDSRLYDVRVINAYTSAYDQMFFIVLRASNTCYAAPITSSLPDNLVRVLQPEMVEVYQLRSRQLKVKKQNNCNFTTIALVHLT